MKKKTQTRQKLKVNPEKVRTLTAPVSNDQLQQVAGGYIAASTCDLCPTSK